ncbi:Protein INAPERTURATE POLLEN1 [Cardamine amara subsp. amara]|uniref:Protein INAPERTURATE POLLEN1 n=1 Tax=Cardamine amara subsp. amara TaxID=228776 RepID=A0ABD1AIM4_CARAN
MSSSIFNVEDFYFKWYKSLTRDYLPLLPSAASATSDVEITGILKAVLDHMVLYYETLERCADHNSISRLFSTSWLNSHETPFLFLGNIHLYLFTNLLRSFIHPEVQDSSDTIVEFDNPWNLTPSAHLWI